MIKLIGDSRKLPELIEDHFLYNVGILPAGLVEGVPCVVGSPPYNVAIPNYPSNYHDHHPWPVYDAYARMWAKAIAAILCDGGRAWINVQPTVPLVVGEPGGERVNLMQIWNNALLMAGLHYRDTVFWVQDSFDGACAWGSWCKPTAPNLRGGYEVILLYYKNTWKREAPPQFKGQTLPREGPGGDWVDLVRNVWKINPANPGVRNGRPGQTRANNLPAQYPLDIPRRAIRLSTWPGEWVVDPWAGHCTTGVAADELERESVMVDLGYADA